MNLGACALELACLCEASYGIVKEVTVELPSRAGATTKVTWQRGNAWHNPVGFYAAIYRRAGAATVLAFRGTDDGWDGLVDDVAIAAGGLPPQAVAAIQVAKAAGGGSALCLTGHSLGGALALIAAAHLGASAVSFNAPGVMDSCSVSAPLGGLRFFQVLGRCLANPRTKNIRIDGDPVSSWFTTGMQSGNARESLAAPQCGIDPLCRHGISTCVQAMRRNPKYLQPLSL